MKKLNELFKDCDSDVLIKGVKINSKEVVDGDLFVCTMGVTADRHDFIDDAISHGAAAIVVSHDVGDKKVPIVKVADTNKELPYICQRFYDFPDEKLTLIGVTGTDGKTSTATIIQTLIGKNNCGYIGTNGRSYGNFVGDNPNTTPDADKFYSYLNEFVEYGCSYASTEASSEAFFRGRLVTFKYDLSILTNITSEHLNIHGSFENYIDCKKQLFRQTKKDGFCILNKDDLHYNDVIDACNGKILTYGISKENDLQIVKFDIYPKKTDIIFNYEGEEFEVESPLLGDFNVYNLAAALLSCLALGFKLDDLLVNIKDIKVSGRLDVIDTDDNYFAMVDYAHTPNGITKLLNFVHTLNINRSIVVIGQAGERDYLKRPKVGEVVVKNSSYAIFTYEDPRSEDPRDICNDIVKNVKDYKNYEIVIDRSEAIQKAIDMAGENDIVLVLGKGNETYEKLKDKTIYFNDEEEVYKAIKERKDRENSQNENINM